MAPSQLHEIFKDFQETPTQPPLSEAHLNQHYDQTPDRAPPLPPCLISLFHTQLPHFPSWLGTIK